MTNPTFSICVYCGSRPGDQPGFIEAARATGRWIGEHGGQLVYGGGRSGLMGEVAEATRQAGGRVVGVIPQALVDKDLANHACVGHGFMGEWQMGLIESGSDIPTLLQSLVQNAGTGLETAPLRAVI
jgi:uncharacterized protein (TIGR00730 family)